MIQVMLIKIVQVMDIRILKSISMESVRKHKVDWRDLKNNYDTLAEKGKLM